MIQLPPINMKPQCSPTIKVDRPNPSIYCWTWNSSWNCFLLNYHSTKCSRIGTSSKKKTKCSCSLFHLHWIIMVGLLLTSFWVCKLIWTELFTMRETNSCEWHGVQIEMSYCLALQYKKYAGPFLAVWLQSRDHTWKRSLKQTRWSIVHWGALLPKRETHVTINQVSQFFRFFFSSIFPQMKRLVGK